MVTAAPGSASRRAPTTVGAGTRAMVALSVAAALTASACAPSLSTMQSAHVGARGRVTAAVGQDVFVAPGSVVDLIDAAKTLSRASETRSLTDDEKAKLFDTGVRLGVTPPIGAAPFFHLTYVPIDRLEVGLRYAAKAPRLAARWQFLRALDGAAVDLSAGLGVARFTQSLPIGDVVGVLEVDDFERWQIDVPMAIGRHGDFYRWWAGPRLVMTTFDTAIRLDLTVEDDAVASLDGTAIYAGAQAGLALGWKHLFVAGELTLARTLGNAHVEALGLASRDVDLGAWVIVPAVSLMADF